MDISQPFYDLRLVDIKSWNMNIWMTASDRLGPFSLVSLYNIKLDAKPNGGFFVHYFNIFGLI